MRESIFMASIRYFFIAAFAMAGVIIGVIIIAAIFGAFSITQGGEPDISYSYTPEVLPNAEGVRKLESDNAPVVLRVNISSVIGLEHLTRKCIREQLVESRERVLGDRVKAILLYIDSPGGTVFDADGIYHALKAYKEKHKVPIYAFVDGLCASGGYYVAAAADKIYASNTSLIGSVGVLLTSAFNVSSLMEKIGVQSLTLYDGKGKDDLNPFRPWKKNEGENLQASINYFYHRFVDIVTAHRPQLDKHKLVDVYGANVYPAPLAKEYGYIDVDGADMSGTLKELVAEIGIHDNYYQVVQLQSKTLFSELFGSTCKLLKGEVTHRFEVAPGISSELNDSILYLYSP